MLTRTSSSVLGFTLLAGLAASAPLAAATISISDLTEGAPTVTFAGWTTNPRCTASAGGGGEAFESVVCDSPSGDAPSPGPDDTASFAIGLLEKDDSRFVLSDTVQFSLRRTNGRVTVDNLVFRSFFDDIEVIATNCPVLGVETVKSCIFETGEDQLVASAFGVELHVTSDIDAPATLGLLALALAGLNASRRRRG